jgi:hypothetical protein
MKGWSWLIQYGLGIALALVLATLLSQIALFQETSLSATKLRAVHVVQFLGYGGALLLLWLAGLHAARQVPADRAEFAALRHCILPLITLIVVIGAYKVLWLLGGPFLGQTGRTIYNWVFVAIIISAAVWLTLMWFLKSAPMMDMWTAPSREGAFSPSLFCPRCRQEIPKKLKFCGYCGVSVRAD